MEVQALPLLTTENAKDQPQQKPSAWKIVGDTIGLGLFLLSLLAILYVFAPGPATLF